MDFESVFKRYDIRGSYPEEIDEEFAKRLGKAIGSFIRERGSSSVVVCRDPKKSSATLKDPLVKGLCSTGVNITDVGVGPTDYAAFAANETESYGVQITSSHLPLDTNGFKLLYPAGNGFLNPDLDEIRNRFREKKYVEGDWKKIEQNREDLKKRYLAAAEEFVRQEAGEIEGKVAVETMNGAASEFLPELAERLGGSVIHYDSEIDPPDPGPQKLEYIELDRAVATDMDADRVIYRDNSQQIESETVVSGWMDGDRMFVALAEILRSKSTVASVDTSSLLEREGFYVEYTRVGDPFVISKAVNSGAELAGEPNGHYCFPEFVAYNSGTVAAALLLAAEPNFAGYNLETARASIDVEDVEAAMNLLDKQLTDDFEIVSRIDGVKYIYDENTYVLVRPSGTEDKLRVVSHSDSYEAAVRASDQVYSWLRNE